MYMRNNKNRQIGQADESKGWERWFYKKMHEFGVEKTIWIEENVTKTTCRAKWFNFLSNLKSARATNDSYIYKMPNICTILKLFLPFALDLALALAPSLVRALAFALAPALTLSLSTELCLWINNPRRKQISMQYDSDNIVIVISSSNTIIIVIVYVVVVVIVFQLLCFSLPH